MTALFIVLIVLLILGVVVFINFITQKRLGMDTILALTGGVGTGKSKVGVSRAVKRYRKMTFLWIIHLIKGDRPEFYSNIPIYVKNSLLSRIFKKLPKYEWAKILKYEHVTLQTRLNDYVIIFIDELGQFADQYSYNNPFVQQYVQKFIRFYRHYTDGYLIVTDQSSSNIAVQVRRRINVIYNLSHFRRWLFFWYKTDVDEVMITEDMLTIKDATMDDSEKPYFMGHLPFKWLWFLDITRPFTTKKYDSRCYKPLFNDVSGHSEDKWSDYLTTYLIDLPNNAEMKKQFQRDGFVSAQDMMKYLKIWKDNL
jgi:hypothetical protein